ncbi:MAG: transcriptional repressor [Candidatus Neomarinimicrobiota bacterium]|nr:transcriptional repressor [Candidatus Neomarinimicrobiota bacterium]RKY47974.1 MAG: transcriptional repressor [Candidatus Neomarinimicrobiota bacterium]RKY52992.1 MAG: transcriptional repressor [Candidatus Neomarinimicrobiota bacterium]
MMGPHWWYNRFRGWGYRLTIPRQAILEILSKSDKHLSAEEIYLEVHKEYPSIGLATIYRTLELLVQMGIVNKFDFGDGRARYELAEDSKGPKHHHHLICNVCGRVIDYRDFSEEEKNFFESLERNLSQRYNFEIKNHQVMFYGICDKCKGK